MVFQDFLEKSAFAILSSTVAYDLLVLNSPHLMREEAQINESFPELFGFSSLSVWNFALCAIEKLYMMMTS